MINDKPLSYSFLKVESIEKIEHYVKSKIAIGCVKSIIVLPGKMEENPRMRIRWTSKKFFKRVLRPEIKRCARPFKVKFSLHKEDEGICIDLEILQP